MQNKPGCSTWHTAMASGQRSAKRQADTRSSGVRASGPRTASGDHFRALLDGAGYRYLGNPKMTSTSTAPDRICPSANVVVCNDASVTFHGPVVTGQLLAKSKC